MTVDCGALQENLISNELFGHERGAFTGAEARRIGAFERANGGTLLVDEVGELSSQLQTHLLGVLERHRVRRLGGNDNIDIDVRVISATNRDLKQEVNRGRFRLDLYYRLSVVRVVVPPLRDRIADVPLLLDHFLNECGVEAPSDVVFNPPMLARLMNHSWPGNVRELRNLVEATLATGELVAPSLAPQPERAQGPGLSLSVSLTTPYKEARGRLLEDFEQSYLSELLARNDGNVSASAREACLTRSHLFELLKRHGFK